MSQHDDHAPTGAMQPQQSHHHHHHHHHADHRRSQGASLAALDITTTTAATAEHDSKSDDQTTDDSKQQEQREPALAHFIASQVSAAAEAVVVVEEESPSGAPAKPVLAQGPGWTKLDPLVRPPLSELAPGGVGMAAPSPSPYAARQPPTWNSFPSPLSVSMRSDFSVASASARRPLGTGVEPLVESRRTTGTGTGGDTATISTISECAPTPASSHALFGAGTGVKADGKPSDADLMLVVSQAAAVSPRGIELSHSSHTAPASLFGAAAVAGGAEPWAWLPGVDAHNHTEESDYDITAGVARAHISEPYAEAAAAASSKKSRRPRNLASLQTTDIGGAGAGAGASSPMTPSATTPRRRRGRGGKSKSGTPAHRRFSQAAVTVLREAFAVCQAPATAELVSLAARVGEPMKRVRQWFYDQVTCVWEGCVIHDAAGANRLTPAAPTHRSAKLPSPTPRQRQQRQQHRHHHQATINDG